MSEQEHAPRSRPHVLPDARALAAAAGLSGACAAAFALTGTPAAAWLVLASTGVALLVLALVLGVLVPRVAARALPGGRRVHAAPVPQVGGWVVGPIVLIALAIGLEAHVWPIVVGAGLVWATGVIDDVRGVRARTKLAAQVVGALVAILGGVSLDTVGAPGLGVGLVELGPWGDVCLLVWIVGVTNAFNLVDGLDGLLGMLTLVALGGLALGGLPWVALAACAGAVLGVLAYNLPRARVFFGDSGSMFLGFVVAVLAVGLPPDRNLPLALGLLAVPLLDLCLALARRWVRGIPLSAADLGHLHHRMYELTGGRRGVALLALTSLALVPLGLSLWRPGLASLASTVGLGLVVVLGIMRLGRARLSRAIQGRRRWQRLYLLEAYIAGLLRLARGPEDVRRALGRLVDDLPLGGLALPGAEIGRPVEPRDTCHDVLLEKGAEARWWCHDPERPPESLALARETVVCELVRIAARQLEGGASPAPAPVAAVEVPVPPPPALARPRES